MRRTRARRPICASGFTAALDLALESADGNLRVFREGEIVHTASITIGGR